MDQKEKDSAYWIAVLLAGLVLGVIAGLAIAGIAYPIYQSEKWAAWVQALGSIGAVLVAVFIMNKNRKDQERVSAEQEKEMVESAVASILTVLSTIYCIEESLQLSWKLDPQGVPLESIVRLPLNTAKKTIEQIPWHTYPYTKIIHMADVWQGLEVALDYFSPKTFPLDEIDNQKDFDLALVKALSLKEQAKSKMSEYRSDLSLLLSPY